MPLKKKETGYSLLEVSVALGIAAIVAVPTTGFAISNVPPISSLETQAASNIFNDLEDVSLIDPEVGEIIVFNGVEWVNQKLNFNFLGDVQVSIVPSEGDVVAFNGTNWVNQSVPAPELANLDNVNLTNPQAGQSLVWNGTEWVNSVGGMTGEVQLWADSAAPEGWLIADGRAVSRVTYAALFDAIGTTYGAGDGATTFNLPDFSGRVGVGMDSTQTEFESLGTTGGVKAVTLTETQLPVHTHTQQAHGHEGTAASGGEHGHTGTADSAGAHTHAATADSAGDHTHSNSSRRGGADTKCCGKSALTNSLSNNGGSGSPSHSHTATVGSAGAHTHTVTVNSGGAHSHDVTLEDATAVNQNAGNGEAHNNLQPYIVSNYIIKY